MKLLIGILFCLCMSIETGAVAAPLDKSVQVDVVMSKITTLLQANKEAEALPYFQQLEAMDTPLPESFYFYYIDALDKSGDANSALSRAEAYLSRYGKKGKYYGKVVAIMSRLSIQADKEAKEKAALEDFKSLTRAKLSALKLDFDKNGRASDITSAQAELYIPLVTRLRVLFETYNQRIMAPAIDRLKTLREKKERQAAGMERDGIDAEIRQLNNDIGMLSENEDHWLSKPYTALEVFRLKSDARIIEYIRLYSYIYPRLDEKRISYVEAGEWITRAMHKFESVMYKW